MAIEFAKNGYNVAICARTRQDVEKTAGEIRAMGHQCSGFVLDVADFAALQEKVGEMAEKLGGIDVLVACAGVYGPIGRLEENSRQEWENALRINLLGTVFTVRAVLPIMKRQGNGCIIAMAGGGVGGKSIKPNFSAYVTSKFAVCGFVEALAGELEGSGVRINAISPGPVNTRLLDQVLTARDKAGGKFYEDSLKQKEKGGTPPELAAKFAVFLASGQAAHLSGKMLSAVWDKPAALAGKKIGAKKSLYTLRRIDGEMFGENEK
jgi:NAD(P)-dependent dehydrogenase (short-subunit alcohol dehydrogenase family)